MGTEVAISFSTLRAQLENEKSNLFKIDEHIKKIVQTTGRFNDRFNSSGEHQRGNNRAGGRNAFPDEGNNFKNDDQFVKRKHETKTVFSRLSARVHDSDGEDDAPDIKRARVPSAVCRELPTRAAVLRAQGDDEQARTRNRRIFGSLLGTLQKFRQEEIVLQSKVNEYSVWQQKHESRINSVEIRALRRMCEVKPSGRVRSGLVRERCGLKEDAVTRIAPKEDKRAQVERKIEEQARLEKEREQKERKTLFAERDHKKATIKALEAKMARVQEFEKWEESQKNLANFILTRAKPHVYWLPKKMTEKATEKLVSSRKYHEKCMIKKRQELQEELQRIEQRCLRPKGPGAKENDPDTPEEEPKDVQNTVMKKRDKFAMDVDKEESDIDDRHEEENGGDKEQTEADISQTETTTEQNAIVDDGNTNLDATTVVTPTIPMEVTAAVDSQAKSSDAESHS